MKVWPAVITGVLAILAATLFFIVGITPPSTDPVELQQALHSDRVEDPGAAHPSSPAAQNPTDIQTARRGKSPLHPGTSQGPGNVLDHPDSPWNGSTILEIKASPPNAEGRYSRVTLLQPQSLPYPIRIEEKLVRNLTTGEDILLAQREMVANRILVKLSEGSSKDQIRATIQQNGGHLGDPLGNLDIYRVHLDPANTESVPSMVKALEGLSGTVEFAEPDFIRHTHLTPNDPSYPIQWGQHNTGQEIDSSFGVADADTDAPEAWDVRTRADGVVVAVIDTGILYTHEDLADNMWRNPGESLDGIDNDGNGFVDDIHGINAINNSGDPLDDNGHGTHCAGIIGAVGNNGTGVAGMAWNVELMGVKFLSASGSGSTSDMITCVNYAVSEGADIINASFGGGGFSLSAYNAIENARNNGVIFVAAAGNDSFDNDLWPSYPSNYNLSNIVSVASTNNRDRLSSFSNFGDRTVDIGAPGSDIYSTYIGSNFSYRALSGTSMAAPQVAGALAIIKAQYPSEDLRLIDRILATVDPLEALSGRVASGGRLNLNNAIRNLDPISFPRLETTLEDVVADEGDDVILSVTATGENLQYEWKKDGTLLPNEIQSALTLTNVTAADSGLYEVRIFNDSGAVTSSANVAVLGISPELGQAMDDENGQWRNRSLQPWVAQNTVTWDGVDAASNSDVGDNQSSTLERIVNGPGTVRFYWKVSSERGYDYLTFKIDGERIDQISGITEWAQYTREIPEGQYTLSWTYEKDYSISSGDDQGYLDAFEYVAEDAEPPVITEQPTSQIVAPGDTATFSVTATGTVPLSYQWFKDSISLQGETAPTLTLTNVSVEDGGFIQVNVLNEYGSTLSNIVELEIAANQAPRIIESPASQTVTTGSTVQFSVRATGTNPLSFQWIKNGEPLSGQTAPTLLLASVDDNAVGAYQVQVSNNAGSVTSATADLNIVDATIIPVILKNPESQTVVSGSNIILLAEASGARLSYQWYKDGNLIPDQTRSSLVILNVTGQDAGQYEVEISNGIGTIRSEAAWVNILLSESDLNESIDNTYLVLTTDGEAPWFTQIETTSDGMDAVQSGQVAHNGTSRLSTTVEGPGQLSFEWKVSSEEGYDFLNLFINNTLYRQISGEVDWTLGSVEVPAGTVTLSWEYTKDLSVAAGADAGWLDQVLYNSESPSAPRIIRNPERTYASEGDSFNLSVELSNLEGATVQWRRNGTAIPGAFSSTLSINQATLADAGSYSVVVSNGFGSAQSRSANVAIFSRTNPYGQALDNDLASWTTAGNAEWFAQNTEARDKVDALQTPSLADGAFSAFATEVEGPGIAVFWWRTSSEATYDELDFFIGDTYIESVSGESGWKQNIVEVNTVGTIELYWQYVKDDSVSSGLDTAWVDQLAFYPSSDGPAITSQPQSRLVSSGDRPLLSVSAVSRDNLAYQWYEGRSGDTRAPLPGATTATYLTPAIDRATEYWVRVSDSSGQIDSATATILVQGDGVFARFPDAIPAGDDWYYLPWFGLFKVDSLPWIFHESLGWWFAGESSGLAEWFYDPSIGWLFTTKSNFPYLWSFTYGDWIYYQVDSMNPRFFYLFSQHRWIQVN